MLPMREDDAYAFVRSFASRIRAYENELRHIQHLRIPVDLMLIKTTNAALIDQKALVDQVIVL
jgi:hypothetical protein